MLGEDGQFRDEQGCLAAAGARFDIEGRHGLQDRAPCIRSAFFVKSPFLKPKEARYPSDLRVAYVYRRDATPFIHD
jgi:hypothetical protein